MDALDEKARNQLLLEDEDSFDLVKINEQVPIRARTIFEENYLHRLEKVKHKPHHRVELRGMLLFVTLLMLPATHSAICPLDMHKEGTDCDELIMITAKALNSKTLKLFCLSIIQNDIESHIKFVINQ
jgi:hypothetical protein